ncbi:MAG: hypothetical protein WAL50_17220 [Kineosporiaceae bacterium]
MSPATPEGGDRPRRSRAPGARPGTSRPQRIRVTSPRMGTAARPPARSPAREIDEQTGLGEIYMRSLLRAQLRQAITVIAVMTMVLGALPLLLAGQPELTAVRVSSIPLPWLLIGVATYPAMTIGATWLVHAAERAERDFAEIVSRR